MSSCSISPQEISFLWLEVTAKCNLECSHCYADSGPQQQLLGAMTTKKWLQILDECSDLGCRQIQFIGGEPTLHPDLPEMITFAYEHGYSFIEIFTNATRINDNLMQAFVKHKTHVAVSFYSDDPHTHDTITKRKGSFEHTVRNIKRLVDAGLPVRAGIIETRLNVGHSSGARGLLESFGVSEIRVDRERGVGRGASDINMHDPMSQLCGECWKGKLCVTSSGKIYPCVFSRFANVGNAKEGISTVLANSSLRSFRAALRNYKYEQQGCDPTSSDCEPRTFRACHPVNDCNPYVRECTPYSTCGPDCNPSSGCMPTD